MIQYIYFVKCPNCEDEHFDFFDEAKGFALGCLSKKPIITQVEVDRNDFGECTDSNDLGTIWSWEDECQECETEEPGKNIFTKDDLKDMANGKDPEFDALDNSVDVEDEDFRFVNTEEEVRKPIPEGMTIEQLVEEMEENEDMVECTWCNDLFPKDGCRKEVDLGYLCSRCEAAIKSRGEKLTFVENDYWDFLDEDTTRDSLDHHDPDYDEDEAADFIADQIDQAWDSRYDDALDTADFLDEDFQELSFSEIVTDSINHLINDLGKDSSAEDFADDVINDIENNYNTEIPDDPEKYRDWASAVACEVSIQLNNLINEAVKSEELDEHVNEEHPAIESEQKLDGIDNALVDCEVADVITHSEDEKPVDCKGKKKPLEKPLTEATTMIDCPECGAKKAFDKEAGVCNNCGFII